MDRNSSKLAKLSQPRLHAPMLRSRLFSRLDALRGHSAIWVSGPPGAGKTTMVASYLDDRRIPALWCQLDAGDLDPATFFHYLSLAAKRKGTRREEAPPQLRSEYLLDLAGFARRFFRALYARMAKPGILVLDNVQEVAEGAAMDVIFEGAVSQVPEGINLVLISRTGPSQQFSHFIADRSAAVLNWDEIRFTLEETRQLVDPQRPLDDLTLAQLHARSAGWAAGLVLLLERLRSGRAIGDQDGSDPPQQLFDYFAAQILTQSTPEDQHILLHASFLPRITVPLAAALTGSAHVARLLERLYRHHLFTDRRQGVLQVESAGRDNRVYEFHALFRAFLRHQAGETYAPGKIVEIARRAGELLEEHGAVEDAVPLHLEGQNWPAAESLILREAERFITQGRGRMVNNWLGRLPAARIEASPWILYWTGVASLAFAPAVARQSLERAYQLALAAGDEMCQVQAAAGVVESYFHEYSHFIPLDRWIPVLRSALEKNLPFPSKEAELRVWLAFLDSLTVRPAAPEMLEATVDRVFALFPQVTEINLKVSAARTLLLCNTHNTKLNAARQAALLVRPLLDHPDVFPITRAMALFALSWFSVQAHEYDEGMAFVAQMERLAKDQGMPQLARLGHYMGGLLELFNGNAEQARERARLMEQTMFPNHPYDMASNLAFKAWIGVVTRDPALVLEHIPRAIELFDQVGSSLQRQGQRNPLHWAYAEIGDRLRTLHCVEELRSVAREVGYSERAEMFCGFSLARLAMKEADPLQVRVHLGNALRVARERQLGCWTQWFGSWMPEMCAEALRAQIEPDFVRSLIREYRWPSPSVEMDEWPWPVRVRTLGVFELELDGRPVEFSRKTPKKLLALLKVLVASGGREVPQQRIIDALWPQEEGDAAHEALNMAVHRLRLLLGDAGTINQTGASLSLSSKRCWVDAWAFEWNSGAGGDGPDMRAMTLYQGPFLQQESDASWAIPMRERLRARFIRVVERQGHRLEQAGRLDEAIGCYLRGLEVDELVERFYQCIMRCHLESGRHAEGLSIYRRMRQTLSVVLGILPSSESESLYRQLLAPAVAPRGVASGAG